jgi:hypothetical protein
MAAHPDFRVRRLGGEGSRARLGDLPGAAFRDRPADREIDVERRATSSWRRQIRL